MYDTLSAPGHAPRRTAGIRAHLRACRLIRFCNFPASAPNGLSLCNVGALLREGERESESERAGSRGVPRRRRSRLGHCGAALAWSVAVGVRPVGRLDLGLSDRRAALRRSLGGRASAEEAEARRAHRGRSAAGTSPARARMSSTHLGPRIACVERGAWGHATRREVEVCWPMDPRRWMEANQGETAHGCTGFLRVGAPSCWSVACGFPQQASIHASQVSASGSLRFDQEGSPHGRVLLAFVHGVGACTSSSSSRGMSNSAPCPCLDWITWCLW